MKIDKFGQQIFTEDDLIDLYLTNPNLKLNKVLIDSEINFSNELELENVPLLLNYAIENLTKNEFDESCQNKWFLPKEYINFDIAQFILSQCKNDNELQRAGHELLLYQERNMFNLLKYLKYFVDILKENNIVIGVGRGSSVASFVLYLLGVHKINSLYYDLQIEEFLK